MKKLPDLEAWALFAKVAETGSFARAASELSVSQATVSKAITRLEARMKTMLFHRTSRRVMLTTTGHAALERASRILEEGMAVESDVVEQAGAPRGMIRLSVPMSFGISHLSPILPEFMAAYPDVELDIHFNDRQVDLVGERFDLAVRIANLVDSSMLARRLCTVRVLLVGAPSYFARYGRPQHPRDLATHRALQYAYANYGLNWRFQHKEQGEFVQTVPVRLHVNNAEALMPALLAGQGLALQPEFLAWQDLRSGALETAMDDWQAASIGLHIVTPPGRSRPLRVQTMIEFLSERFANAPWAAKG